jgi:glutamine amidotransferase
VIALVDYGSGNIRSVHKALLAAGADVALVKEPSDFSGQYHGMVLPGVGAFDDCVSALHRQELWAAIKQHIDSGKLFLGICVGYQALFEKSEEFNSCATGLEIFQGKVIRFPSKPDLKVPQIGWNQLELSRSDCPLFNGIQEGSYAYFVHSFYPEPEDPDIVVTRTDYGVRFASSVWRDNVFATQFHPEKSQGVGMKMLQNFVDLVSKAS